jgi:hypothetical protein
MRDLRAISTRAAISRTTFSNHYEHGDLKANPRDLLVKYFDASLYFAHWMYLEVAFRFPKDAVDVKALRRYAGGHTFDVRMMAGDVIVAISVESDGEAFDAGDDGSAWLSSVIVLRTDIANGDHRTPYLAWLLDVQGGVIDDDAPEPAQPGGLGALSPALESFVDIIGLDRDSWRWPLRAHRKRSHNHRAETSIGGSAGSMVVSTSRCSPGSLAAMGP